MPRIEAEGITTFQATPGRRLVLERLLLGDDSTLFARYLTAPA